MKYIVTLNNKQYEIEVEKGDAILVSTTEVAEPVAPVAPAPVAAPAPAPVAAAPAPVPVAAPAPAPAAAGEQIKAPMPGVIVSVNAAAGQTVKEGDVLLILEAMKMENEITAPRTGTIVQVLAQKGASVETGAPLFVIA